MGAYYIFLIEEYVNPVVALNSALRFTPLEIMPRCSLRTRGPPSGAEAPLGRSLGRRQKGRNSLLMGAAEQVLLIQPHLYATTGLIRMDMNGPSGKKRFFDHTIPGRFLSRPNRFLICCKRRGRTLSAFLPNSGRLQELLQPGRIIHLVREENSPNRKTRYTAVAVDREEYPIMLHTHRSNEVARYQRK